MVSAVIYFLAAIAATSSALRIASLMALAPYNEAAFRAKVDAALNRVRTLLDNTRSPQYASEVPHKYEDKYFLADSLTNSAINAHFRVLEALGLTKAQLSQLKEASKTRSISLRLKTEEKCKFLRKVVREVESDTKSVSTS